MDLPERKEKSPRGVRHASVFSRRVHRKDSVSAPSVTVSRCKYAIGSTRDAGEEGSAPSHGEMIVLVVLHMTTCRYWTITDTKLGSRRPSSQEPGRASCCELEQ